MLLSIIVVNWNTRARLAECLTSVLEAQDSLLESKSELIVIDNASTDGSVELVREQFPWVNLVINKQNLGFARASNQGIAASSGKYLLLLNSDTVVHPDAFAVMVSFLEGNPNAGACGPRLLNTDGSLQLGCLPMLTPEREFWRLLYLDRLWPRATYPLSRLDDDEIFRVEVVNGACMMVRRQAIDEVGLLDERYYMYTEEVDYCYRLARSGWQLWYVPAATVTHHGQSSTSQQAELSYLQLYGSKVQFYRKIGGKSYACWFKLLVILAYFPRLLLNPGNRFYRRLLAEIPGM